MRKELTAERLKQLLSYDPDTGYFAWRGPGVGKAAKRHLKQQAGCLNNKGYRFLWIDGALYRAHRLAWLYMYGVWPPEGTDHVNLDRDDNRIANLRPATHQQNMANRGALRSSKTGIKGVRLAGNGKGWMASISAGNNRARHLGTFKTQKEAAEAYRLAATERHGEFVRTA
jgi:hypothetical protein